MQRREEDGSKDGSIDGSMMDCRHCRHIVFLFSFPLSENETASRALDQQTDRQTDGRPRRRTA
eukprot:scaffold8678_cov131-Amphora_coffeaeformis.AAC.1